jgi:hypothetical protein
LDAAGRHLDEEEHVEALQEERVDGEEVALEDARRLLTEEVGPGPLEPLGRRLDPFLLEDRPDGACSKLDAEPDQFSLIRRYPQLGFSRASRTTSSRIAVAVGGRPGRRYGYIQRRATNSRCQRSSVAGVTNSDAFQACRGQQPANAASSARSACASRGRAT